MHRQRGGGCQSDGPALLGPLRGVDGKGVLGIVQHWHQDRHLVDKRVEVLGAGGGREKVGRLNEEEELWS